MADLFAPLISPEKARNLAQKLFKRFDRTGSGVIDKTELTEIMRTLGGFVKPMSSDDEIGSMKRVLDSDGNNIVTPADFEMLVLRYFCGQGEMNLNINPSASSYDKFTATQKSYAVEPVKNAPELKRGNFRLVQILMCTQQHQAQTTLKLETRPLELLR